MNLKFEVVLSSTIKRKKPWPRFCWLGQEKESVFLLDDRRISEINLVSGRTKKKTPKLHHLLSNVVTMATSHNGMWLCGLLVSGGLFLWNRDKDVLKTAAAVPEVVQIITSAQENSTKLCLQVSCDGMRVLLAAITGQVFLWECTDVRDFTGLRDGLVKGHWMHIRPLEETVFPSSQDKEASQHTIFLKTEVMGDVCLSAFVFTSGKQLIITIVKIQWNEGHVRVGSVGCTIFWATKTYPMSHLTPPCHPVKSRGALVPTFSPDGQLLAVVLNQRTPKATQVLFVSTQNFVSISSGLRGCGSKKKDIPSKYIRSYWVGSVCWSPGSLFLACVLKRGSLLMLARLGGLLTLTTSGCNVDFGPAHFLPLHPLVTYRPTMSAGKDEASLSSSSLSVRDILRQRYSVTWHPRLLYLIVSDGYMATVMRVLDRPSPALFLKTLLKDTSRDLEKASSKLDKSKVHVKAWLESVSCLNLDSSLEEFNPSVTCQPKTSESIISAATDSSRLPLFLQDQQTLGGTKNLLESMQAFFEEESDLEGLPAGSHMEDGGRLAFASMFDTLHALETYNETLFFVDPNDNKDFVETEKTPLHRELGKIQSQLLTAWAFGMSLGDAVEHRVHLLKYTLCCVVRFAALLHLAPSSMVLAEEKDTPTFSCLLHLIKALLSFLSWDRKSSVGPHCLGLLVEFSKWIVRLLLTPHPGFYQTGHCPVSSQSLSRIMKILHLISDSLDHVYSLQQKTYWSSEEKESPSQTRLWTSDVYHVPHLQIDNTERSSFEHQAQPVPHRPSSRLLGVWQLVYDITQQYADELTKFKGCDGWKEEEQKLSVIMSQVQTALQATGECLEEGRLLMSHQGERYFLCGSYPESADAWRSQICQEANKRCDRSVFLETRLCLALLYSLLSQYRLNEAQQLGDHMAQLILLRAGNQINTLTRITADSLPCPWVPVNLHSDAACTVIQTLGRFMASYFTNQPLFILPAHNVTALPPLHLPHARSVGRLVPLSQKDVAKAVRQQHLSEVWTVDYALDLLLLGGLLPEAVWLAYHLGDWKTAVTLSLAYTSYCTEHLDFTLKRELYLPTVLQAERIFQAELDGLFGSKTDSQEFSDKDGNKSFAGPLEGEDWDVLQTSIQEILKASVMAGVNVMSSPLSSLLEKAKSVCSSLPALVPTGLYLPSPPLYCPQPSPNTQDQVGKTGQFDEISRRHKVSGILQRFLLLLRSARCCHPAAQWYISRLKRARHILFKIKKKYSYPSAAQEEKLFPEELMKLIAHGGYFKRGPNKDGCLDPDTIHTIFGFRELCALCWMLHVRDQLSLSCRKYQAARQHGRGGEISDESDVNSACIDAVQWACRLLPFCHFLNAEEVLQDVLLSLMSELPPLPMVAETLVKAFPKEEESVRVSLREKYNLLLQRLKQSNVLDAEKGEANESMAILIKDKKKLRRKHLARLQRHLAPPVLHLWEKEEDKDNDESKHNTATLGQLSLGPSLSTGTLTDVAFQPVCSDVDTAVNTSRAVSPEENCKAMTRSKKAKKEGKYAKKLEKVTQEKNHMSEDRIKEQPSLPVIGSWEFELEDDEYLNFLELFLSYVLEKDSADGGDFGSELPFLRSFCFELRERELHSITFDVFTTIHRRQSGGHHPERKHQSNALPVFRAGSCYKPELQASSVWSEDPASKDILSMHSHPGEKTQKQKGLFGLQRKDNMHSARSKVLSSETSPVKNAFSTRQPSESFKFGSSVSFDAVTDLQQGLDPKLEAQFPELGRLLEWMVRWADRRVLLGLHGKKKKDEEAGADEGVVIRVKASAPAVLTSLSLLEWRCTALPLNDCYIPVPDMQWTAAPVRQPEVDRKLERESSVDTGYPGSANTPIAGLDHLQQAEIGSCTDEPEEATFQKMPPQADQAELDLDSQMERSNSQHLSFDDLDVAHEKEDTCQSDDNKNLDVLSSGSREDTSGSVCTPERSFKLKDLDYSEKAKDMPSSSSSLERPEAPAPPSIHPINTLRAELPESSGVPLPSPVVDPPNAQPGSAAISQPPTITSPMRQRLGEDLFRLVQHINYMSLNEIIEASFSNIQQAQQSSFVALTEMNSSHPKIPSSSTKIILDSNVLPVQTTVTAASHAQECVPNSGPSSHQFNQINSAEFTDQPVLQNSANQYNNRGLPPKASGAREKDQVMQPLSVQAESPGFQQGAKRKLIPSSQGLLVTTDSCPTIQNTPMLVCSDDDSAQSDSSAQMLGLKLLKLHHPVTSQDRAAHYPSAQQSQTLHTADHKTPESFQPVPKPNDQATWKRKGGGQRTGLSSPTKHLSLNPAPDLTSRNSLPQIFSILRPTFPTQTPRQGLRLLQLQYVPQSSVTFPRLTQPSVSRPAVISVPLTGAPMIKLLHIESGPKVVVPPTPMTRLISKRELMRSEVFQEDAEEARLKLLRVDPSTENRRTTSSSISSKRQKRRKERAKGIKTEVTFRPNESIIPTQEAEDVPVSEEPALFEEITPGQDIAGSSDSLLTGQRLLDRVYSTSAELHAFASTSKRPPECHDAFTNTEPACSPVFVDKAVSVQASITTSSPKSQSPQIFQIFCDDPVRDTEETPQKPEEILNLGGRQFLRVLDLEDGIQHEDFPPHPSPEVQNDPFSPTSAQLHVLATSVIRAAGAEPQPSVTVQEDLPKPSTSTDIPDERPSFSHYEPQRIISRDNVMVESSDSEICRATKAMSLIPDRTPSSPSTVWFSSRLSKLDDQLAALQNIADHLELDFANSKMLVNEIEKLSLMPIVKMTIKKTVRLSVPVNEPKTCEGIEDEQNDSPSSSLMAGPSSLHTPPGTRDNSCQTFKISHEWADVNLDQTEFSDTLEILDELVKEGYLSPTDWKVSTLQTESHSRQDQQQSGWTSQQHDLPGDERKKLMVWMRRKHRERLAAYQKHRENLKQMERKPFSSSTAGQSANINQSTTWRTRQEKEKFMLLKRYDQRTHEACLLAADIFSSRENKSRSSQTDGPPVGTNKRSTSAPPPHRNLKSQSGHPRPQSVEGPHSEGLHRRMGLHRPVTVLPGDRLSQITRRGMLSNTKSQSKCRTANQKDRQSVGNQRIVGLNKTFSSGATSGRHIPKEHTPVDESEAVGRSELSRLQGLEESDMALSELLGAKDPVVTGGVLEADWSDKLSENGGSILSKIDWAAIERMATDEDT